MSTPNLIEVSGCVHGRTPVEVDASLSLSNTANRVAWWVTSYAGGSTYLVLLGSASDLAWKLSGVSGWCEANRRTLAYAGQEGSAR